LHIILPYLADEISIVDQKDWIKMRFRHVETQEVCSVSDFGAEIYADDQLNRTKAEHKEQNYISIIEDEGRGISIAHICL
jgi:hypothetical protein